MRAAGDPRPGGNESCDALAGASIKPFVRPRMERAREIRVITGAGVQLSANGLAIASKVLYL